MSKFKYRKFRTSDSQFLTFGFGLRTADCGIPKLFIVLSAFVLQALFLNPIRGQSLDDYLQIAVENNPEVKAYYHEYLATVEQIRQAGALPDPELSVGFFFKPMDRFMGRQHADIQLMQMFPWFGMPGIQRTEAANMSKARYERLEESKNNLVFEVKNKWYEMYRLQEESRILAENIELIQTYERLALVRFQNAGTGGASSGEMPVSENGSESMGGMDSGNASTQKSGRARNYLTSPGTSAPMTNSSASGMSDVLRIRMQLREMESNLAYLEDTQELLKAEFNQLLNRRHDQVVTIADTLESTHLVVERMALLDSITANNPMLKMLDAEMEVYASQREMARLDGKPMLGVGLNYMPFSPREGDGMSMGGKDMVMPMVSITLPVYRKKYKAMTKAAELNQMAVQNRKENAINQLAVQWRASLIDLDDANRKTALYNEQTALARQTLKLLLTSYSTNGQGFDDVLQVQQELLNYQLQLINAVVKQHTSIAMLEMLAATVLVQ